MHGAGNQRLFCVPAAGLAATPAVATDSGVAAVFKCGKWKVPCGRGPPESSHVNLQEAGEIVEEVRHLCRSCVCPLRAVNDTNSAVGLSAIAKGRRLPPSLSMNLKEFSGHILFDTKQLVNVKVGTRFNPSDDLPDVCLFVDLMKPLRGSKIFCTPKLLLLHGVCRFHRLPVFVVKHVLAVLGYLLLCELAGCQPIVSLKRVKLMMMLVGLVCMFVLTTWTNLMSLTTLECRLCTACVYIYIYIFISALLALVGATWILSLEVPDVMIFP